MFKRYIGALILSPFVIIFLLLGGIYLKAAILVLSLFGMYEFYKAVKNNGIKPFSFLGYIMCILYYFLLGKNLNSSNFIYLLIFATMLLLCIPVLFTEYNYIDVAVTILGFNYVAVFFSFIVLVDQKSYGNYLVWLIFLSSWACDILALYAGKCFGKNKLCPKVSPKKTIEGSIGGFLGSTIVLLIYGLVIRHFGVNIELYHFVVIGIISGIFCQFGDLAASTIKRHADIKDYSNLIPGHGGILDRFDSILFASVIVYYYITFVMGI